jgi:ABC-type molybdate transport system substrate-binding protein
MRSYFAMCIAPLLGISSGACASDIKVLCDGPLRPALTQVAQAFERDSGHQMKVEFGLSPEGSSFSRIASGSRSR